MQWPIICLFLIAIACLIVGLRKSALWHSDMPKQFCTLCGWTQEQVQPCQIEQHQQTMVVPLCFECSIKHDAVPVKTRTVGTQYV